LPFEQPDWLPASKDAVEIERAVLEFWKKNEIFEKSLRATEGGEPFVFYEGPPTANGMPHPGHVLTRVMKDVFPRYHTMNGRSVPRKAGWDTHGLPVEIEVEKELGLESKDDIEKYGVEPFIKKCVQSVWKYTREWEELTERIGFWVDLGEAYVTYKKQYVESVWWALSQLWDQKLLYEGHKIVPWCPRCGTGLSSHEVGWGYKSVDDPSITIKFKVKGEENTYLLAWTTTPWTLLSNAALAVKPDADYIRVRSPRKNDETWVLASARLNSVCPLDARPEPVSGASHDEPSLDISSPFKGSDLAGWEYEPLFAPPEEMLGGRKAHYVVTGDFVTLDDGTGIVHIAPAFGADDQAVGQKHGLPTIIRTDAKGRMTADTPVAGKWIKDADKDVIRDLKDRGLLVRHDTVKHEYPHCWRCDTPLLYYPRSGWFIKTTEFRDRMLEHNASIKWFPEHIRDGRFGNFLRDNIDWALSRERYWGTPLPLWKCESCAWKEAVSSLADLSGKDGVEGLEVFAKAREADPDIPEDLAVHKPYIDSVAFACPKCSSMMRRTPEVIDCWFDSGAMPFAQWGYPHVEGSAEKVASALPADFISEAIDQTRGWFYSLLAISTMLPPELGFGVAPYKTCVVLGLVCDEKGFKMSKSKGNYVEPSAMLDKQGADAMRWYFLSANQPWTSVRFSERNVAMANKDFLIKLRNVHQFFLIYARIDGFDPAAGGATVSNARASEWKGLAGRRPVGERSPLDRWILSELAITVKAVRAGLESYDAYGAAQALSTFVESLSNWYLRRSRPRYWGPGKGAEMSPDKSDAYWTLYESLVTAALLAAPFTPFAAEDLYQTLVRSAWPDSAPESVHLAEFPREGDFPEDARLSRAMALAREAATLGRAARAEAKIKVRQPLASAEVAASQPGDVSLLMDYQSYWKDELNVDEGHLITGEPEHVRFELKPNFKVLGPRLGPKVKQVAKALSALHGHKAMKDLRENGRLVVDVGGDSVELGPDDVDVRIAAEEGYAAAAGPRLLIILNTEITPELELRGLAREIVSRVQAMRKDMDLAYEARIETYVSGSGKVTDALAAHSDYVMRETLTERLVDAAPEGAKRETAAVDGEDIEIAVREVP